MSAKRFVLGVGAFVASGAFALGTAGVAHAQLGKVDQKCRDSIAKSFAKAVNSAAKVSSGCHKNRNSGKVDTLVDCNDLSQSQADSKGKFAKAKAKVESSVAKSCTDAGASAALVDAFISCPEPCETATGVPNPLATFSDVAKCLGCLAGDVVSRRDGVQLGMPASGMSKDEAACHAAIAKGYNKHLSTLLKERQSCQKTEDKTGNNELQPCDTYDQKSKIGTAATNAAAGVADACASVDLNAIDSCSNTDVTSLNACLLVEDNARGAEAFDAGYGLPATICPAAFTVRTQAGFGINGPTATRLEAGWNGIGHGQDLVDQFSYGLGVNCSNTSPPCGTCSITGFTDTGVQSGAFTRCRQDTTIPCDNPFGTDPDCPGLQECTFYVGPPLPLSAGNNPVCIVIRASSDASGTIDVETGDSQVNLALRADAYLGLALTQPCPICTGDVTPQDGVKEGTCQGGTHNGDDCDVQGFDATFGSTSLDCGATPSLVSGANGLRLDTSYVTGISSLPFGTKCDFPQNALDCACAVCSGDNTIPCNSDAECSAALAGTCSTKGSNGSPPNRLPNGCSDLDCADVGNEHGECVNSASDTVYCDEVLRANGKGLITCLSNADCDETNIGVPGGNCSLVEPRSCFLDPIVATGSPDPETPIIAGTFCTPTTVSPAVNAATGLPAASRAVVELNITRVY